MVNIITECPCCSSKLERVKDQLFCRNKNCEAQNSKRVENFTKKAKVKGFGGKTIEKLGISTIPELYELTEESITEVMGEKMGAKLIAELVASKRMTLATFLSSLSIPLIGNSAAGKLVTVISSIEDISKEACNKAGLGEKVTASLLQWKLEEYPNYSNVSMDFSTEQPNISNVSESSITVCCTGKIIGHTRGSLQELLASKGIKATSTVTKTTKYLVCDEAKGSSKEKKADSLGIEIISLTELLNRI